MIRSALRAEISGRVFDSTNAVASASTVNLWIDLAIRDLWARFNWPFKTKSSAPGAVVTVANVNTLTLPVDLQEVKKLVNTDLNIPLLPRNERWLEDRYPDQTQVAMPLFYVDGGLSQATNQTSAPQRVLRLYPTPDKVYKLRLRYLTLPSLPSAQTPADSAFGPLPEDFDEAIIQWCLVPYTGMLADPVAQAEARSRYLEECTKLVKVYRYLSETMPAIDIDLLPY